MKSRIDVRMLDRIFGGYFGLLDGLFSNIFGLGLPGSVIQDLLANQAEQLMSVCPRLKQQNRIS